MVQIVDYAIRENSDGEKFCALIVSGGLELVKSSTGKQYATLRKCSIVSTLNEEACQSIIGSELPGTISKVECDPYEYTSRTGQNVSLSHRWQYEEGEPDDEGAAISELFE